MSTDEISREDLEEQLAAVRQELVENARQLKMRESERDLLAVMLNEAESSQKRAREKSGLFSQLRLVGESKTSEKNSSAEADLLDFIPAGIIILTQLGVMRAVNKLILSMTGYSSSELIGQKIDMLYEREERNQNTSDFISSAYSGMKNTLIRKDGTTFAAATALNRQSIGNQIVFCIVRLIEKSDS